MTGSAPSTRLRAGIALPAMALILATVLLGTPDREPRQTANAQPPAGSAPVRAPGAHLYPARLQLQGVDLSTQTAEMATAKSFGCVQCHQGQHEPHGKPETVRLGCVDCHGGNRGVAGPGPGPRLAPISRGLAAFGQSRTVVHALEPRVARVHPVREPGRPASRARELRNSELPHGPSAPGAQEHDDPRCDALGSRTL